MSNIHQVGNWTEFLGHPTLLVWSESTTFQFSNSEGCADKKTSSLSDFLSSFELTPEEEEGVSEARNLVAEKLYSGSEAKTIRAQRLLLGMSQLELADAIGTSQPHIARIERGTENIMFSTGRKLCAVLGCDMNTLDEYLLNQEAALKE